MEATLRDATTLFVVIDPIGQVPLFLALTRNSTDTERRRVAFRCIVIASIVLGLFILGGQFLLGKLGISLPSFQIAGGIVLFLFGLRMIFEEEGKREPHQLDLKPDVAVFPLGIPSIAGPGSMMAVVLMTDRTRTGLLENLASTMVLAVILGMTYVCLRLAVPIQRLIGDTGANVVSRVLGLILAALAVEKILEGIKLFWNA
ncbi:MarC family protein [Tuwongella immobilis]|uniref:UPF0056 membrane protein n=1 Tax=Tuwongella immobilis TaxID=692036 RepID=A0A6C2YHW4_9BACT|nr:MarC family protein [Tuwongella immobilis]VIP01128.1 family transcriptional regulator : Multiple antibiotic resistance (MarC)-like protein OS=Pseudoalteromonas piscicida JCM 20779 GN=PPIS_20256 PE=4 SV=1: MarC [Tuwongella immobilis]VTR97681.1 family transcriptional regulator : Multiple antibiotic resistance (MarC)-like protein OS=Pseudoalteromonas piscicida JCM 20779 GN=PPIS_20256 PE=4 SV=1: MarC [Tuwongella immobilis]